MKGFTLVELLIVITIIAILAGVIIVSLSEARSNAKNASLIREARSFASLLHLQYSTTGSYAALQSGWDATNAECNNSFSGTYVATARATCRSIVGKIAHANEFYTGNAINTATHFSVMVRLSTGLYYCIGSSGQTSTDGTGAFDQPGCSANP